MISVYFAAFNLYKGDYLRFLGNALHNYAKYGDEIVCATLKTDDDKSLELLRTLDGRNVDGVPFRLVETDFTLEDPEFDGKLKNAALQECRGEVCLFVDLDEIIIGDKKIWEQVAAGIVNYKKPLGVWIPSINIYGDLESYSDIGFKYYLHSRDGAFRGVVNYARNTDGSIDITKSDTTELIDKDGALLPIASIYPSRSDEEIFKALVEERGIAIVHLGSLDLDHRVEANAFWKPVWESRAAKEVGDIILDKNDLVGKQTKKHNLDYTKW